MSIRSKFKRAKWKTYYRGQRVFVPWYCFILRWKNRRAFRRLEHAGLFNPVIMPNEHDKTD